jgi:hypothetical protein
MIRAKWRVVTLVGVLACGAVALFTTLGSARGATGPAQIRITDIQLRYRVARPANGGAAGEIETIMQRLYNPSVSQKSIGRSFMACTFIDSRNRTCVATYVLPKGTLVVTGALESRLFYDIPIVGGTGLYDNARGTLTVTATHLRPRHEVLLFRLVG